MPPSPSDPTGLGARLLRVAVGPGPAHFEGRDALALLGGFAAVALGVLGLDALDAGSVAGEGGLSGMGRTLTRILAAPLVFGAVALRRRWWPSPPRELRATAYGNATSVLGLLCLAAAGFFGLLLLGNLTAAGNSTVSTKNWLPERLGVLGAALVLGGLGHRLVESRFVTAAEKLR